MVDRLSDDSEPSTRIEWLLAALPPLIYALLILLWARNAPFWDDYEAILSRLLVIDGPDGWRTLGESNNEHLVVTTTVAAWLDRYLFGVLDFRHLIWLGNLALLASFTMLSRGLPAVTTALAGVTLFNFSYWEGNLWAMTAVSHYLAILLPLTAFVCLQHGWGLWPAVLAALLSALSQANGMLVWPIGALWLAWERRWADLSVWMIGFGLTLITYRHLSASGAVPQASWMDLGAFFVAFMGGLAGASWPALVLGALVLLAFLVYGVGGDWKYRPVPLLIMLFLLGTAIAATLRRAPFGFEIALSSRYAIISSFMLAALVAGFRPVGRELWWVVGAVLAANIALAAKVYPQLEHRKQRLAMFPSEALVGCVDRYNHPDPVNAARSYEHAVRAGWLALPLPQTRCQDWGLQVLVNPAPQALLVGEAGHIDYRQVFGSRLRLDGWMPLRADDKDVVLYLASSDTPTTRLLRRQPRADISAMLGSDLYYYSGFSLILDFADEASALRASQSICLAVVSHKHPPSLVAGSPEHCRAFLKTGKTT
ncbi:hypothetical protein [Parachitinimonas caeni]|uniref:Transmembrane protein n=1 Tax=Parachitinimonas caeni TaxID=3031301 RepID=A0ABT7DSI5_9NEIS|nr:hypothetical protein [Parachitinimonas caeni]MDK2122924.1 hypothetical protein [Parachitinimonas caeni]